MIFGIGVDIVSIARIERVWNRHGERFARRLLAEQELSELETAARPARFLAKRFAAKEAVAKAFGTGFRGGLAMKDIQINHGPTGRPALNYLGRAAEIAARLPIGDSHISIADEQTYAVAFVTLSRSSLEVAEGGDVPC